MTQGLCPFCNQEVQSNHHCPPEIKSLMAVCIRLQALVMKVTRERNQAWIELDRLRMERQRPEAAPPEPES